MDHHLIIASRSYNTKAKPNSKPPPHRLPLDYGLMIQYILRDRHSAFLSMAGSENIQHGMEAEALELPYLVPTRTMSFS